MANTAKKLRFVVGQSDKTKDWSFVLMAGDEVICKSGKFSRFSRCKKFIDRIKHDCSDAVVEFDS